jgi:hypothetical protein
MTTTPEPTPPNELSPATARIKQEIEQTRDDLSVTVAALEEKLAPSQVREAVGAELKIVEERVRDVIGDQLAQARNLVAEELLEAKQVLRDGLSDADRRIREGLRDARTAVRAELKEAVTGARESVRAATLGKVENFATTLGDSMNDARDTLLDTLYANPLPAALTGVGVAWLLMNRSRSASTRARAYPGNVGAYGGRRPQPMGEQFGAAAGNVGAAVGKAAHRMTDAVAEGVQGATDTAGQVAGHVMESASDVMSTVAQTASEGAQYAAHTARDGAAAVATSVQQSAKRVEQTLQRQLQERPLAVGAAALAIGTMVGCALPRTNAEDELMGEARDSLLYRAGDAVHDAAAAVTALSDKPNESQDRKKEAKRESDRPSASA